MGKAHVTTPRPELQPAADAFNAILDRFLAGKVRPLSSRLVGLAIEIEALEQEAEMLRAAAQERDGTNGRGRDSE